METKAETTGLLIVYEEFGLVSILFFRHSDQVAYMRTRKGGGGAAKLVVKKDVIIFSPPRDESIIALPESSVESEYNILECYALNRSTLQPGTYYLKKQSDSTGENRILCYLKMGNFI